MRSELAKPREAWLDYVRFFSIWLVIVFHTPPQLQLFDGAVILNLRVPVFFCISGFLYSIDKYDSFARYFLHRGRQILVPYCTFFFIFYALWLFVGRSLVGAEEEAISVTRPLWEFITGDPKVVLAPFWYIACLFTMQMVYYWVERLLPARWIMPLCVLLALSTYFMSWTWLWVRFWNFGNALLFLPFYALGNRFKPALKSLTFKRWPQAVAILALATLSMTAMWQISRLQTANPGLYSMLRVAAGFLVIPAYFCCAKWLANRFGRKHVIEFVVISGTVYLGLQNYFIGVAKILLTKFSANPAIFDENIWLKFAVAVAVMIAIYPFAWIIDRYMPWLIGKGKFFERF